MVKFDDKKAKHLEDQIAHNTLTMKKMEREIMANTMNWDYHKMVNAKNELEDLHNQTAIIGRKLKRLKEDPR